MIQVFLDTETTGMSVDDDHRIIELGATVVDDGMPTREEFHELLNPDRDIDEAASAVHGFTWLDLTDKPRFSAIADQFVRFVQNRQVFMHNAPFDVAFIDSEFERADRPERMADICQVTDTMVLAKQLHRSGQVNLNSLCNKYGVDRTDREQHGALLDSRLLAEVYLRMRESQNSLLGDFEVNEQLFEEPRLLNLEGRKPLIRRANEEEQAAHAAYMQKLATSD